MDPVQDESLVMYYVHTLGLFYLLLLPTAGLVGFVVTLLVVLKGKGPLASAVLILAVGLPLLVGVYGTIDGAMMTFRVIAVASEMPRPSEVAIGISTALLTAQVGFWLMLPSLLLAIAGGMARSLSSDPSRA